MAVGDVANARRATIVQEQIGYAGAADRGKRIT
jgi:hypothetical protein